MVKANYNYDISDGVISIVDLGGGMSVTNDIENVIGEIVSRENIDINHFKVIYEDSEGNWDAFNILTGKFTFLQSRHREEAIEKVKKIKLN